MVSFGYTSEVDTLIVKPNKTHVFDHSSMEIHSAGSSVYRLVEIDNVDPDTGDEISEPLTARFINTTYDNEAMLFYGAGDVVKFDFRGNFDYTITSTYDGVQGVPINLVRGDSWKKECDVDPDEFSMFKGYESGDVFVCDNADYYHNEKRRLYSGFKTGISRSIKYEWYSPKKVLGRSPNDTGDIFGNWLTSCDIVPYFIAHSGQPIGSVTYSRTTEAPPGSVYEGNIEYFTPKTLWRLVKYASFSVDPNSGTLKSLDVQGTVPINASYKYPIGTRKELPIAAGDSGILSVMGYLSVIYI